MSPGRGRLSWRPPPPLPGSCASRDLRFRSGFPRKSWETWGPRFPRACWCSRPWAWRTGTRRAARPSCSRRHEVPSEPRVWWLRPEGADDGKQYLCEWTLHLLQDRVRAGYGRVLGCLSFAAGAARGASSLALPPLLLLVGHDGREQDGAHWRQGGDAPRQVLFQEMHRGRGGHEVLWTGRRLPPALWQGVFRVVVHGRAVRGRERCPSPGHDDLESCEHTWQRIRSHARTGGHGAARPREVRRGPGPLSGGVLWGAEEEDEGAA